VDELHLDTNRRWWDERTAIHAKSALYDLPGFRAGRSTLFPFELEEMGDVTDQTLLHLQCHIGLDTLSWSRLGALTTGLDFSPPAIAFARSLAEEIGLVADFVVAAVDDAPEALGRQFDIVYTGRGALIWLPSIDRWAEVVSRLLRPGGRLYLAEFHPLADAMAGELPCFEADYREGSAILDGSPGDYTDRELATLNNDTVEWVHPLGAVVTAIAHAGLVIEQVVERDETYFQRFPELIESSPGIWKFPQDRPQIPLSYSLRAHKPTP